MGRGLPGVLMWPLVEQEIFTIGVGLDMVMRRGGIVDDRLGGYWGVLVVHG